MRHNNIYMWTALVLCAAFVAARADLIVGGLHEQPDGALALTNVLAAALRIEGGARLRVAAPEPGEPLAPRRELLTLAAAGARAAVLVGGEGSEAAAARAGLPLLQSRGSPGAPGLPALWLEPPAEEVAETAVSLLEALGWARAVLLHEGAAPARLLSVPGLRARRLPTGGGEAGLRGLLLPLKRAGSTRFVVWTREAEGTARVLTAAARAGLLAERHSYLLLHLDLQTLPLANYSYGGANITGLRLFDPESATAAVRNVQAAWLAAGGEGAAPAALALSYDGARLLVRAWRELRLPATAAGSHAESLVNELRCSRLSAGATGPLRLDGNGRRHHARLQVVELARGGQLQTVAEGHNGVLCWQREGNAPDTAQEDGVMTNRSFNVLIAFNDPYVMRQESKERLSDNDRYEGFCIELIQRLAEMLHFNYTFILQEDGEYGSLVDPKRRVWNGMLGRLREDTDVHFAITDLTITEERETDLDFTTPFMNLGISILFKKPETPEPELFAFLLPFSTGVWLCLGLALMGASLTLYVAGRLCPAEWQNPHPCVEEPTALQNQFSLGNAVWFNLGAILLQGSEIAPLALGTRGAASVWWLFALIVTSYYTANLATLLARKTTTVLIQNVEQLADNPYDITYGAKVKGSTIEFFKHSRNPLYQRMYEHMKQHTLPADNKEGVKRVKEENFAFLMESTSIEYITQRDCDVTQVGGLLDNKGYGIAMMKNSPYRQGLNLALLHLQERGVLREMKQLWWNEKHGGGFCDSNQQVENQELSLKNFRGLFLVLGVGTAVGVVVSLLELVVHAVRGAEGGLKGAAARLKAEFAFVFRFASSVKPLRLEIAQPDSPGSTPPSPTVSAPPSPAASPPPSPPARRRSTQHSIHTASVRLARHASGRRS